MFEKDGEVNTKNIFRDIVYGTSIPIINIGGAIKYYTS